VGCLPYQKIVRVKRRKGGGGIGRLIRLTGEEKTKLSILPGMISPVTSLSPAIILFLDNPSSSSTNN